jgi:hypothetical protein
MKNFVSFINIAICTILQLSAVAQPLVKQSACDNVAILQQADSLKQEFEKQGFVIAKEASVPMESEYEIPVVVPLRQGTWYRVIFIGDVTSRVYEVRMFDWNERQVVYQKKMWGDVDGNIINYDYIPQFTEYHMIKPLQINKKKKQLCGYFMIFKKVVKPE